MASKRKINRSSKQLPAHGMGADFTDFLHGLAKSLFDPYRPELHYMRGPGPKWHAKHDPAPASFENMTLVRVKAR